MTALDTSWDGKSDRVVWTYYADENVRDMYERDGRPPWVGHAEVTWDVTPVYDPELVIICHPDFGVHRHDQEFYRTLTALANGIRMIAEQLR